MRNMWLMDYFCEIMAQLMADKEKAFTSCVKDSYNSTLGKHHSWLIRKGAQLGMNAVGGREAFMENNGFTYTKIEEIRDCMHKFKEPLWEFYTELKLTDIE